MLPAAEWLFNPTMPHYLSINPMLTAILWTNTELCYELFVLELNSSTRPIKKWVDQLLNTFFDQYLYNTIFSAGP